MSLATWLRAGRDRRKLTIDDVAKITKIQPRILEKLESGQLEGLPAEVFVKGFVRSFAKCVGLDETEALDKYSAAQAAPNRRDNSDSGSFAIAKALVETMQRPIDVETVIEAKRVAQGTPVEPAPVVTAPIEAAPVEAAPIEAAPIEAAVIEPAPVSVAAPAIEASVAPVIEAQVVAAAVASEQPQPTKKKRSRKNSKQRAKHKKQVQEELAAVAAAVAADVAAVVDNDAVETSVFEKQPIDTGPVASIFASGDGESLEASSIEAKTTEPLSTASEPEPTDGVVESAPLAEGSNPTITIPEHASGLGLDIPAAAALDATSGETTQATWQPTMPPIATPSMPWRRPNLPTQTASRAPVVPSLLIDDADPDSADREREDRIAKEPNRLSFLPPILLDREDRSARQGGLTLAVIILLIAATLTLSYLMRRPSPSGDGVTMLDGASQLIS
ncbi:MAG TPA: helix-turn-helix domain-containing protein [Kofleriaceae bacterium]|nr:helix-turn-helix domain-containing protein [Kofleriaceae bacterium]